MSARPEYRDLVIEMLADSEAELLDRIVDADGVWLDQIVDLKRELSGWQAVARAAIHALREREIQITRLRESLRLMREERRRCLQEGR